MGEDKTAQETEEMIRRVQLSLKESNPSKLKKLDRVMGESIRVINKFIDIAWTNKITDKFALDRAYRTEIGVPTWLSGRLQKTLWKQAIETIKSQRKKHKKTKPVIRRPVLNLTQLHLSFKEDVNSFDFWIKIWCLGDHIILNLPSRKHKHFLQFKDSGWVMRKGGRLRKTDGWFLDVYFEKKEPPKITVGDPIGIDIGYKKLIACSNGKLYGSEMVVLYDKIARKKQGSKAFKRSLTERDQTINRIVNKMDLNNVSTIVAEDLKSVKRKSKFSKKFNNRLQRWSYSKVLKKFQSVCDVTGLNFVKVDPAYTSQTCSLCGFTDKKSRNGEQFCCVKCGFTLDADVNAAKVILQGGAYSASF